MLGCTLFSRTLSGRRILTLPGTIVWYIKQLKMQGIKKRLEKAISSGSNCFEYYTEWANAYDKVYCGNDTLCNSDTFCNEPPFITIYFFNYPCSKATNYIKSNLSTQNASNFNDITWGDLYERFDINFVPQDTKDTEYMGPTIIAKEMATLFPPETRDLEIIDMCAGTGLVGENVCTLHNLKRLLI